METQEFQGYVYCPPQWNLSRLTLGKDADSIINIAHETLTDIGYIKSKNQIQITGDSNQDVLRAQTLINQLLLQQQEQESTKSKSKWVRPDKPGAWGSRRDGGVDSIKKMDSLRKMKSDAFFQYSSSSSSTFKSNHNFN